MTNPENIIPHSETSQITKELTAGERIGQLNEKIDKLPRTRPHPLDVRVVRFPVFGTDADKISSAAFSYACDKLGIDIESDPLVSEMPDDDLPPEETRKYYMQPTKYPDIFYFETVHITLVPEVVPHILERGLIKRGKGIEAFERDMREAKAVDTEENLRNEQAYRRYRMRTSPLDIDIPYPTPDHSDEEPGSVEDLVTPDDPGQQYK